MPQAFDWKKVRKSYEDYQPTRDAIIKRSFVQWVDGNSDFEDRSAPEMSGFLNYSKLVG